MNRRVWWTLLVGVLAVAAWRQCQADPVDLTNQVGAASQAPVSQASCALDSRAGQATPTREDVAKALTVVVCSPSGAAIPDALIYGLAPGARGVLATDVALGKTGSDGRARLESAALARRLLVAAKDGHRATSLLMGEQPQGEHVLTLHPEVTCRLEFKDLQGVPVAGLRVALHQAVLSMGDLAESAAVVPLDDGRRGVAAATTDQQGTCILRGLKAEPYWLHWDDLDWAEVAGPDGRVELKPGDNRCTVTLSPVLALVGPEDVVAMGVDLPAGLSNSAPSSVQGVVQIARWRLKQKFPTCRNIAAVDVGGRYGNASVKVAGWTNEGLRFEEMVVMSRPSAVQPFVVRGQQRTGAAAHTVRIDLMSADGVPLNEVELGLEAELLGKPLILTCESGKEVRLPMASYAVSLRGWGVIGAISEAQLTQGSCCIGLPEIARKVRIVLTMPDGKRPVFAIERAGSRLSTFYDGVRMYVLRVGAHNLEFQVPGWKSVQAPVVVDGSSGEVRDVAVELSWHSQ